LRGESKMEYRKGPNGFSLEFNKEEESNFETFVNELKNHNEFSNLIAESEFLALIINEGVASLQYKINNMFEKTESENFISFHEFLATMLNENISALLQYKQVPPTKENVSPVSLDDLLNLIPNINQLYNETDQPLEEYKSLTSLDEPLTINNSVKEPSKNID
jgi:hypothetical protein